LRGPLAQSRSATTAGSPARGKTNFEVVVYPGDTHAFTTPFEKPVDYLGHHMVYDEKATQDAQQRADAFMAAHLK
jgi:dienelactone hydrolase